MNLHRNKRSMTLNLKLQEARELFYRMVKDADIVVENYRPDVKKRLGIDYETLARINPRIILASISGFGHDGPYSQRPGFDQIAQGLSGIMSVTGKPGEGPMRVGCAVADVGAGLLAALGVMTALLERERSGKGQWVQSTLLQAGLTLLDFQAARYLMKGEVPGQVGNDHPTSMPTSAYKTSDGYINVASSGDGMWKKLCNLLGREDLIAAPEFKTGEARAQNRAKLNAVLGDAFSGRTSKEWVEEINGAGIPCGPIYKMDEVFADPQVQHMQCAVPVQHKRLGKQRLVGQGARLSRTPAVLAAATPDLGEHTDEILGELGLSKAEIGKLRDKKVI